MPSLGPSLDLVTVAQDFMSNNIDQNIGLDEISAHVGISKFALTRLFNKSVGMTPARWLWNMRCERAAELIEANPTLQLSGIFPQVGFNSAQHFSRFFVKRFKVTPRDYQKGRRA